MSDPYSIKNRHHHSAEQILQDPKLIEFIDHNLNNSTGCDFISVTIPVSPFDPLACLEMLGKQNNFQYYWEKPDREFSMAAGEELARITAGGSGRFQILNRKYNDLAKRINEFSFIDHALTGPQLLGGFSFFDEVADREWNSFESSSFTLAGWLLIRDGNLGLLTITLDLKRMNSRTELLKKMKSRLASFERIFKMDAEDIIRVDEEDHTTTVTELPAIDNRWLQNVESVKELIEMNEFDKVVLARTFDVRHQGRISPTGLLHRLRSQYPSCFCFLVHHKASPVFIGCSPERLVSFHRSYILTEGLAGSISRGSTASEDAYYEQELMNSGKNRSEHKYVVDAIVERLKPLTNRIEKSSIPIIRKLSNVQHLLTPIRAMFQHNINRFSILETLHPTPAVGGYPREKALPVIRSLEQFDRGWYAGSVGWLGRNGNGEFTVAIRSALLANNRLRIYAGCGIVADSNPQLEWEETNLKLTPILSALNYDQSG